MKARIEIPKGYRRVTSGRIREGDLILGDSWGGVVVYDKFKWLSAYDTGEPIERGDCVIRKIKEAKK